MIFIIVGLVLIYSNSLALENKESNFGIELDALPYLTGGYYLSGWYGKNNYRVRAVLASVNIPEFIVKDGFENNELLAYALIVDYFPKPNFEGVWYGIGLEAWKSSIESSGDNVKSNYENYVFTAGAGYTWYFHNNFYLNPWFAIHGIIGGDERVNVGTKVFEPEKITGEVSLKVGLRF